MLSRIFPETFKIGSHHLESTLTKRCRVFCKSYEMLLNIDISAVSVTEFKVLADKIGAEDPEMKLIPQTAGPV